MSALEEYIRRRIAESLMAYGMPWHLAHCPFCGVPLPGDDHVCEPKPPPPLRGINS